jgi:GT2 family glycosyltransferase
VSTTILVLSVDEAQRLRASLPAAVAQPDADVVVIDNACMDETGEIAREYGARVVALPERSSYAAAVNAGIAATRGEHVLLLNADCVLDPGFLAAARAPLDADRGLGSVAPKLLRARGMAPDERLDEVDAAGIVVDRRRKNALVGHGAPAASYATPGPCFGGDGAAVLWRRSALEACALDGEVLDEDMGLWAVESDLAWRAQLLGLRCAYEPRAVAWHVRYYRPGAREALPAEHRRTQFRNRLLMLAKNSTARDVLRDLPWIATYEVLALGFALVRERELLGGYRDALRLLPGARRRGRLIRSRRRAAGAAAAGRVPFGLRPGA